jgi:hypothetical protein
LRSDNTFHTSMKIASQTVFFDQFNTVHDTN